ncbi:hypothetical protein ACFE04_016266 [Oxalis oulophora]
MSSTANVNLTPIFLVCNIQWRLMINHSDGFLFPLVQGAGYTAASGVVHFHMIDIFLLEEDIFFLLAGSGHFMRFCSSTAPTNEPPLARKFLRGYHGNQNIPIAATVTIRLKDANGCKENQRPFMMTIVLKASSWS